MFPLSFSSCHFGIIFVFQVQDKFVLHLTDEEAVHYMQNLIEVSVSAMMAAFVEQLHKMAQVRMKTFIRCKSI